MTIITNVLAFFFVASAQAKNIEPWVPVIRAHAETYQIIVRGVAPAEAASVKGRVRGRAWYGIQNPSTRPGFLLRPGIGACDLWFIFEDVDFYAREGAGAEAFAKHGLEGRYPNALFKDKVRLGNFLFPEERGYILIYGAPKTSRLRFHPESRVWIPEAVVHIPKSAKLLGAFRLPPETDFEACADLLVGTDGPAPVNNR